MNIFGITTGDVDAKVQNQNATPGVTDFAGVLEQNGVPVATTATVGAYLPLAGGTMSGSIAMSGNSLTNVGNLSGPTNSRAADNIVSCATGGVLGNVSTFTGTAKVVQDSGVALSSLATTAALAAYLPLAGGTMSGSINMGAQSVTNVTAVRPATTNIIYGSNTTISAGATNNTLIGNNTTTGFGADTNVLIGESASLNTTTAGNVIIGYLSASSTGGYSVAVGQQSVTRGLAVAVGKEAVAGNGSTVVGYRSASNANLDSVVLGRDNTSSATSADILGVGRVNNQANSLLLGNGAYINIRSNSTCDLGTVAAPFKDTYLSGNLAGPTNTRTVDNIISCATNGVSGDIAIFTGTAKVVQDSGVLLSSLLSSATAAATYLLLAGGTMSGSINMGAQNITNVNSIALSSSTVNVGNANGTLPTGWVSMGSGNSYGGIAGGASVIYGISNNTTGSVNGQSIIYGNGNVDSNGAGGTFMFGFGNTNGTGQRNIFLGRNNVCPNGVDSAITMGFAQTNNTGNSMLLGISANIRASTNTCDLGTVANTFRTLYLNTSAVIPSVDTAAALTLGPTTATSVAIGRATVVTTVNGIFNTGVSKASWYSTTTYNPAFTAGTNRLTPPTAATAGPLVDFTHALGVLTYTGTRTRSFRINYNITLTLGVSGSNMTFFNSIASSLVIAAAQAQQKYQVTVTNNATQVCLGLEDVVVLSTGNTVQLAGACATLSAAVGYNFISCTVNALLD